MCPDPLLIGSLCSPMSCFTCLAMCWSEMPCYGGAAPLGNGSRKLASRDDTAHGNSYKRKATGSWVPNNTRYLCNIVKSIYDFRFIALWQEAKVLIHRYRWSISLAHLSNPCSFVETPSPIENRISKRSPWLIPLSDPFFLFVLLHHWKKPRSGSIGIDNRSLWPIFLIILHFPKRETPLIIPCLRGSLDGFFFSIRCYFSVILNNWGKPRLWSIDIDNRSL